MIDVEGLAVFVAIAEQRSFSRAADKLGLVQSVISKRLKRLEDQLGGRLVDRTLRTDIRLTRIGEIFLEEAKETLFQLNRIERIGLSLGRGRAGPVRIGFIFSAAMNGLLGTILRAIHHTCPEVTVEPQLMETPEQLAALDAARLDIALVRPRPSYPDQCLAQEVHSEGLTICLPSTHPKAQHSTLSPAQMVGERFIVPQFHEHVGLIDTIHRLAQSGGFDAPPIIRTSDFVTAACLAAAGEGIVLAPVSLAKLDLQGICYREVAEFPERLKIMLAHRLTAPRDALEAALRACAPVIPRAETDAVSHASEVTDDRQSNSQA